MFYLRDDGLKERNIAKAFMGHIGGDTGCPYLASELMAAFGRSF